MRDNSNKTPSNNMGDRGSRKTSQSQTKDNIKKGNKTTKKVINKTDSTKPSNTRKTSKVKKSPVASSSKKTSNSKNSKGLILEETRDLGIELGLKTREKSHPYTKQKTAPRAIKKPIDNVAGHGKKGPLENMKIFPIGGLNEIGKNMTAFEYKEQILVVDCGMSFPEDEMYGIDVVIPDFSYLTENDKKVVGIVITHGHEDHIGAIPYLLKKIKAPIYGTKLPLGLIKNKLDEHGLTADLRPITAGETFRVGDYKIEALRATHSIADAVSLFIQTPAAKIFHTGDFKVDFTPVDGEPIDFARLAEIGSNGVDLLMADSTNVLKPGFTPSERVVGETLDSIFREADNRIIIATFSSNVHRVQKIIELAVKYGRKFAVSGRSMENVMKLAVELGYLKFPAGSMLELNQTKNYPDSEIVIITTGSQGEPMSALARMATGEHRNIKLKKGDMVVLSSTPVPGNEKSVSNVVNRLYEKEVRVIYNEIADIHVSGHACQEDLRLMHSLIKPKFFMPVHGEFRHLERHKELAIELGMKPSNVFILANGDQLTVDKKKAIQFKNVINAEDILVDGLGIGDVGNIVLKDRKLLSESGLIIVSAAIDKRNGVILAGPEIISRGFVYVKEHEELMASAKENARISIENSISGGFKDWNLVKNNLRDDMRKFIFKNTKRSPIILTMLLDI